MKLLGENIRGNLQVPELDKEIIQVTTKTQPIQQNNISKQLHHNFKLLSVRDTVKKMKRQS